MRNLAQRSVMLFLLLMPGSTSIRAADHLSDTTVPAKAEARLWPQTKADEKAYGWCISHFLSLDDEGPLEEKDIKPIARPAGKFRPLDTENMLVPPDLTRETEIVGSLPPEIERHRGLWILPAIDTPSPAAVFVERLTPVEMTIFRVRKNYPTNTDTPRSTLKWDGQVFRHVKGGGGHYVVISADGEAMLLIVETDREAMPAGCFISAKHY